MIDIDELKNIVSEMCFKTGKNTAHDYDGIETDDDVILYLKSILIDGLLEKDSKPDNTSNIKNCDNGLSHAVGEYVKGLGESVTELMDNHKSGHKPWDMVNYSITKRLEILDQLHNKAMDALNLIKND